MEELKKHPLHQHRKPSRLEAEALDDPLGVDVDVEPVQTQVLCHRLCVCVPDGVV